MSSRLPAPPSRTSASRRRIAKLHSSTPNDSNGKANTIINRPIPIKIEKEAPDDEMKVCYIKKFKYIQIQKIHGKRIHFKTIQLFLVPLNYLNSFKFFWILMNSQLIKTKFNSFEVFELFC